MSLLKARLKTSDALATPHPEGEPMPCMRCRAMTPHADLRTYGARCRGCFKAYCEAPQPPAKRWGGRTPGQQVRFDVPEAP